MDKILEDIVLRVNGTQYLNIYLDTFEDHQAFRSADSEYGTQTINTLLTKSKCQPVGLKLLVNCLDQCSVQILEQKASVWITLVLRTINTRNMELYPDLVFDALGKLAVSMHQTPELTKAYTQNCLSKTYELLDDVRQAGHASALRCITACIRLYPGSSGPHKKTIERFLKKFIDTPDEELNIQSGKCQHVLLQIRGRPQGSNFRSQWESYQLKLIGNLHKTLDHAFSNCLELFEVPQVSEPHDLPLKLSDEPIERAAQVYIRFRNLSRHLEITLREPFPVAKPVHCKPILNLLGRGLSMTCSTMLESSITDNFVQVYFLPRIHLHLLQLLQTLIEILGGNLRPYYRYILELLVDTLKWTSLKPTTGIKNTLPNVRIKVYEIISLWCSTMRDGSSCKLVADSLVQQILTDIMPMENELTLKVLSGARKHMSKKARRQLHKTQNEHTNLAQVHSSNSAKKMVSSDKSNSRLCIAALDCLQKVLLSNSPLLKPTLIKIIHLRILPICCTFYQVPPKCGDLYYNALCRLGVLKTLHVLTITPHHLCPPPTQMTISIMQTAANCEHSPKIRQQIKEMLLHLEKLMHPQKEGLLFPLKAQEIRDAFIKFGQEHLLHRLENKSLGLNIVSNDEESEDTELNFSHINEFDGTVSAKNYNANSGSEVDSAQSINDSYMQHEETLCLGAKDLTTPCDEETAMTILEKKSNSKDDDDEQNLEPPAKKHKDDRSDEMITKLSESPEVHSNLQPDLSADDDVLIAEIEAEFVDELN